MTRREQTRGCLLGLAVGDALGAPLEFSRPASAAAAVADGLEMTGGSGWDPGEWTDDTTMALCLADSLLESGLPLDLEDLAHRYAAWAAAGPKDIGITTRAALAGASSAGQARENAHRYHQNTGRSAGNGTVMRAAPIALATDARTEASQAARADAVLTHYDPAAGACSAALCAAILSIGAGEDPVRAALDEAELHADVCQALAHVERGEPERIAELAGGPLAGVAWTTLAVGIWALAQYDYEAGVQWAISLGGDTDTNAAVTGALIGFRDGAAAIPERWLGPLRERERIESVAEGLSTLTEHSVPEP
jgi:ADP-ribosyl-[dinitrogen reductase] hydrolase